MCLYLIFRTLNLVERVCESWPSIPSTSVYPTLRFPGEHCLAKCRMLNYGVYRKIR